MEQTTTHPVVATAPIATILLFAKTFGLVALSRLPFLSAGYGLDPDTYRVAATAQSIAATHTYSVSRFPGYPVQEIVCALISGGGPLALNGATALLSAVGFAFFALALRNLGSRAPLITSVAASLVPIVYISSTQSIDYLWALGFLLTALYFVTVRRVVVAGVLVGFAFGSRLTSCLMVVPFVLHLVSPSTGSIRLRLALIVRFVMTSAVVGLICYSPVLFRYGLAALTRVPNHPGLLDAAKIATLDTWGLLGCVALAVGAGLAVVRRDRAIPLAPLAPWAVAVVIYVLLFWSFPNEAGYLIPVVPFVVLFLDTFLPRRLFVPIAFALALSSFVLGVRRIDTPGGAGHSALVVPFHFGGRALALDVLGGPVFAAHSARLEGEQYVARVRERARELPPNSVLVVGYWWPKVAAVVTRDAPDHALYVERIGEDEAATYEGRPGSSVYYLARQKEYNQFTLGIDLDRLGAKELPVE